MPARVPLAGPASSIEVTVVPAIDDVVAALGPGDLAAVAVDMPIGLPARGSRTCDVEARRRLGPRRNSVFPAPVRAVLGTSTYEEACAVSRQVCGKALSKQLYNIVDKIREVDAVQSARRQERLFEACPELSFAVMAGDAPMQHSKRTADGEAERIAVLQTDFGLGLEIAFLVEARAAGAQRDDVLDALALAWTARRYVAGSCLRLGGELDATGLRMEVVA
jgi:predicted RNase H-like nuclease